jgi:hypothetical protein
MKIKFKANYSGYIPVLRAILYLLKDKTLNFTQLGAYIAFVMQADWYHKHQNYGLIIRDDYELAKEWGVSPSTVNRRRNELIEKGLLQVNADGITRVTNISIFELSMAKTYAKVTHPILQTFFAKTEDEVANEVQSIAEMLERQTQKGIQSSNISSKGELGSSNEDLKEYADNITENISSNYNESDEKNLSNETHWDEEENQ